MKYGIIIFSIVFSFICSSYAQESFKQNTKSIGGSISFYSKSPESGSTTTVLIARPQFDYFILNNLSLGLIVNIENTLQSGWRHSIIGFGPGARYYFQTETITPFIGTGYLYSIDEWKSRGEPYDKITETQLIIDAGLELFISGSLALEPLVSYKFVTDEIDENLYPEVRFSNGENKLSSQVIEIGLGLKYFIN